MMKKLITLALTSGLAAMFLDILLQRAEQQAQVRRSLDPKVELQRNNDEGAGLPR